MSKGTALIYLRWMEAGAFGAWPDHWRDFARALLLWAIHAEAIDG